MSAELTLNHNGGGYAHESGVVHAARVRGRHFNKRPAVIAPGRPYPAGLVACRAAGCRCNSPEPPL